MVAGSIFCSSVPLPAVHVVRTENEQQRKVDVGMKPSADDASLSFYHLVPKDLFILSSFDKIEKVFCGMSMRKWNK